MLCHVSVVLWLKTCRSFGVLRYMLFGNNNRNEFGSIRPVCHKNHIQSFYIQFCCCVFSSRPIDRHRSDGRPFDRCNALRVCSAYDRMGLRATVANRSAKPDGTRTFRNDLHEHGFSVFKCQGRQRQTNTVPVDGSRTPFAFGRVTAVSSKNTVRSSISLLAPGFHTTVYPLAFTVGASSAGRMQNEIQKRPSSSSSSRVTYRSEPDGRRVVARVTCRERPCRGRTLDGRRSGTVPSYGRTRARGRTVTKRLTTITTTLLSDC